MGTYNNTVVVERHFGTEDPNKVVGEFVVQKIKAFHEQEEDSKKANVCELPFVNEWGLKKVLTLSLYYSKLNIWTLLSVQWKDLTDLEQKMYKAACYCRLSSDDLKDGMSVSIDTQIALEKKYCKENRIHIVDFYCEM